VPFGTGPKEIFKMCSVGAPGTGLATTALMASVKAKITKYIQ